MKILKDRYAFYTAQSYRDADMYEKPLNGMQFELILGGGLKKSIIHSFKSLY